MKPRHLFIIFFIVLIFSCKNVYPIYDSLDGAEPTCFINEKGTVTNKSGNIYYEKEKENFFIIKSKQVVPDYYVPYKENGIEIDGVLEKIYGICFGVTDINGNIILPFQYESISYSEGLFLVREVDFRNKDNYPDISKYGYKNVKNEWIIYPSYTYATPFNNGCAVVSNDNDYLKVINKKGNVVIEGVYDEIYPWKQNLFIIKKEGKSYLINKKYEKKSDFFYFVGFSINSKSLKNMCLISSSEIITNENLGYLNTRGQMFWFKNYKNLYYRDSNFQNYQ